MPPAPAAPAEAPPAEAPPPVAEPAQAPPAWRTMRPKRGRRAREQAAAPAHQPPPQAVPQHVPMMQMDPTRSWAPWQRMLNLVIFLVKLADAVK